ncbi:MAG: class I SAM-dependent methyltransferase [Armatimonadetes bacterium]|nr:class I SAM-dependent methyltransferase [Armatimonadota bacterium]
MKPPRWQHDEFRHVGADYNDPELARAYDSRHERFRGDMAADCDRLLDALQVDPGSTLVDIGCGTGTFAIQAARRCARVCAVDVSPAMLAVARGKAAAAGVGNLTFHLGGFLTYEHREPPADFVTSTAALHHLPDFWKLIGLRRVADMLRDGGVFYLMDTVYSFDPAEHARFIDAKVEWFARAVDAEFGEEVETAFREECSTFDWVMEGLLARAGFLVERADYTDGMLARYVCRKGSASHRIPSR